MKTLTFCLALVVLALIASAQDPDLPGAQNVQGIPDFPINTLIIPMDNRHQCKNKVDGCNADDPFNVKVYGLIERLLWLGFQASQYTSVPNLPRTDFDTDYAAWPTTGVPVAQQKPVIMYWVIRPGKAHNGIDFSVNARKVSACIRNGNSDWTSCSYTTSNEDFRAGAILIRPEDHVAVLNYIDYYNNKNNHHDPASTNNNDLDLPPTNYRMPSSRMISAYLTTSALPSASVPVRHVLTQRPFIGVMDSVFFRRILLRVLNQALWEPDHRITLDKVAVQATQANSCYTLLVEPHFVIYSPSTGYNPNWREAHLFTNAVYEFVNGGGNFYAQCHGVETYENLHPRDPTRQWSSGSTGNDFPGAANGYSYECSSYYRRNNAHGNFMSTKGIAKQQCRTSDGMGCRFAPYYHFNMDLPFTQMEGDLEARNQANLQLMRIHDGGCNDRGSVWESWTYGVFEQTSGHPTQGTSASGTNQNGRWWQARGSKFLRTGSNRNRAGGFVGYLGGHSYAGTNAGCGRGNGDCQWYNDDTPRERTNGQRLMLNAALIPATRPANCRLNICNLLTCPSFDCFGKCKEGVGCTQSTTQDCAGGICGQFSARARITGAAGSEVLGNGAVLHSNLYFDFTNEKLAFEYYDPSVGTWGTGGVTPTRIDVYERCELTRKVFSCNVCTTLVERSPMPRFFRETDDILSATIGNPTGDATFPTSCPLAYEKGAAQTEGGSVRFIWGRQVAAGYFVICAAQTRDGALYEFYQADGVTRGTLMGPPKVLPAGTVDYNFVQPNDGTCPQAQCSAPGELVFLTDEQNAVGTPEDFGFYRSFLKTVVGRYTEAGGNNFGLAWTGTGNGVAAPTNFQNNQQSFNSLVDGRTRQGPSSNFYTSIETAIDNFFPGTTAATPRRLVVLVGGPHSGSQTQAQWDTLRATLASRQITVWAVGIGVGTIDTQLLARIATTTDNISYVSSSSLLTFEAQLMAVKTCPADEVLCQGCAGWCCCADTCCCPTCTGASGSLCTPFTCTDPTVGCTGNEVQCNFCDTCSDTNGQCAPDNFKCNDQNECTTDSCDRAAQKCVYTPNQAACSDGNACTTDQCVPSGNGVFNAAEDCKYTTVCTSDCVPQPCATNVAVGCAGPCCPPTACDIPECQNGGFDATKCSWSSTCTYTPKTCADNNPCTADSCDPVTGQCAYTPINCDLCVSKTCDDTNGCTKDECDPMTGNCKYTPIVCNDNDACTSDACTAGACVYTPLTTAACRPPPPCPTAAQIAAGTAPVCVDGDICTEDICQQTYNEMSNTWTKTCVNTPITNICPTSTDACTTCKCGPDPQNPQQPAPIFSAAITCDDMDPCTTDKCVAGACQYTQRVCEQFSKCITRTCDSMTGKCADSGATQCDDGKVCTDDSCDAVRGCVYTPVVCNITSPCNFIEGCFEPTSTDDKNSGCREQVISSLIDFCGICLGDNVGCFFQQVNGFGAAETIGVVAAIFIALGAAVILALLIFGGKKGYDAFAASSALAAGRAETNPAFQNNDARGSNPGIL